MTFYSDLDNMPQEKVGARIRLMDTHGAILYSKRRAHIWVGAPIGAWIEYRGIRIALREIMHHEFQGIVPDSTQ